jgi:hypothetical protein
MLERRLPAEIWGIIVEHLPRSSQRSCLSVSRSFHDLAMRPIFSTIDLYLHPESHALDILDRVANDREFAMLVKKLAVVAYWREPLAELRV